MKVTLDGDHVVFELAYHENHMAQACGARWFPSVRRWKAKATRLTAAAVISTFPHEAVDPAIARIAGTDGAAIPPINPAMVSRGIVGVTLRPRQMAGIEKAWPYRGFAFLWVMGAGKTLSTIALANARYNSGLIDQLLVICPTSIKGVWSKEIERYSAVGWDVHVLESGKSIKWEPGIAKPRVLVVGVEALSAGSASRHAKEFIESGKTMAVLDESSTIKNQQATRTTKSWAIGEHCNFRLILSGTSVTQGLQDLYSQFFFVDPCIIGELSFYSFRNKYCVMGGFEGRKIIGYKNSLQLLDKIRPFADTILKDDLSLPPKVIMPPRVVKASPDQVRMSKELLADMETILGDKTISAKNSLEVCLRLQQIAGGFDHEGQPLPSNPKLTELMTLLNETQGKVIIWARFLPEVNAIFSAINKEWPGSAMAMTGAVPPPDRQPMVDEFEASPTLRFFVANQQTAGKGLTITAATTSIYYSNTYSLEDRLQSEDRNHRIGQEHAVVYIDILSNLKVDTMIGRAIMNKQSLAAYVGDNLRLSDLCN